MGKTKTKVEKLQTPLEEYNKIMKIVRLSCACVGCDAIDPNYKMNWITGITITSIVIYFAFTALFITEDWTILLQAFCMVGSVIQGISKLYNAIRHKGDFSGINILLERTYRENQHLGSHYAESLHYVITRVGVLMKFTGILVLLVVILMINVPWFFYVTQDKRLLIMHFHVPKMDVNTNLGYFTTLGAHMLCIFVGSCGNFAADMVAMIFLMHSKIFVDVFKHKVANLNADIAVDGAAKKPEITHKLIEIVKFHKIYIGFLEAINRSYNVIITTQITTSVLSIVLTLYILVQGYWPGGYPYLLYCFTVMYLYCFLGTVAEVCNEQFIDEIYSINWYNLTVSQQKIVRVMLMRAQTPRKIEIAGIEELSVHTGLAVTKNIYSIFMMMLQFVSE